MKSLLHRVLREGNFKVSLESPIPPEKQKSTNSFKTARSLSCGILVYNVEKSKVDKDLAFFLEDNFMKSLKFSNIARARRFSYIYRFIDDLNSINDYGEFERCYKDIYPPEL